MVRTSQLARSVSQQFGIPVDQALFLVQAAKKELEIFTGLMNENQAGEVERLVAESLRAK